MRQGTTVLVCAILLGCSVAILAAPRGLAVTSTNTSALAVQGDCPGEGGCFVNNGTPGCEDAECCSTICAIDTFCCNVAWDQVCANQACDLCVGCPTCEPPACGKTNVECLNPADAGPDANAGAYANSKHVGRLANSGSGFCTAWLIAAPNIVMTNEHCTPAITPGETTVQFNYECVDCPGDGTKAIDEYEVASVLYTDPILDFAILELVGDPAATWGIATVNDAPTFIGQEIYEIHHGEAKRKGYDSGVVLTDPAPQANCPGNSPDIQVSAIATGGASGSPIFDSNNHSAIAICHCGEPCSAGFGIPLADIWPSAKTVVLNAGGVPNEFCPADTDNNNSVDVVDLLDILASWGPCPPPCPPVCDADVNCDCVVDVHDLLAILVDWGPCG